MNTVNITLRRWQILGRFLAWFVRATRSGRRKQ
jgi:hypothetical protein